MATPVVTLRAIYFSFCVLFASCQYQTDESSSIIGKNRIRLNKNPNPHLQGNSSTTMNFNVEHEKSKLPVSRNRRDLNSDKSRQFYNTDGNRALHSAFRYNDQIMRLLQSQSPKPLNLARSEFFYNILRPLDRRTTRYSNWDDHSVMHFGKRSIPSKEPSEHLQNDSDTPVLEKDDLDSDKRSYTWSDHSAMHFGKRPDEDDLERSISSQKYPSNATEFNNDRNQISGQREIEFNTPDVIKKDNDPWHNMMSFGKRSEYPWSDHSTMHFGKKSEEPWHNVMSFGKKSDNLWSDHNTMHFGKRGDNDPWHSVMSFGKRGDNDPWHNVMSFGKRADNDPWHSMMSFGKRSDNDPWHSVMSFGKRGENDPWHNMMSFGKKSGNLQGAIQNNESTQPEKSKDNYEQMMEFSDDLRSKRKRSVSSEQSQTELDIDKRSKMFKDHNGKQFGKKSDPWQSHNTMHFGKKLDPWQSHNTMHFGKKSDNTKDTDTTKYDRIFNPEQVSDSMYFGKRYIESKDDNNVLEKNEYLGHKDPSMGKVSGNIELGKDTTQQSTESKNSDKKFMKLKKRSTNDDAKEAKLLKGKDIAQHQQLKNRNQIFIKRSLKSVNLNEMNTKERKNNNTTLLLNATFHNQRNTSRANTSQSNIELFATNKISILNKNKNEKDNKFQIKPTGFPIKRSVEAIPKGVVEKENANYILNPQTVEENSIEVPQIDSVLHFGKRSIEYNEVEDEKTIETPWEKETTQLSKKYENPWENHNTMHFGKKSDAWDAHNTMHFGKRADQWESHNTMHFGKKSDPWQSHNTMHFGKKNDPWESHNTMHFGKKSYPWDSHNTMHFGKKSDPWESHNTMHFGKKSDPWEYHNTMHFGKKSDPWESHNTMHFGKKSDPWDSHNTMHFGKKSDPWENHSTLHFGKRDISGAGNEKQIYNSLSPLKTNYLNEQNTKDYENQMAEDSLDDNLDTEALEKYLKSLSLQKINFPEDKLLQNDKHLSEILSQFYNSNFGIGDTTRDEEDENMLNVVRKVLQKISNSAEAEYQNQQEDTSALGTNENPPTGVEGQQGKKVQFIPGSEWSNDNGVPVNYFKMKRKPLLKPVNKRYWAPFQGPKSIVYPHAWFASQIRRSVLPAIMDNTRFYEARMAEKKEDPLNSFMHFGRR